MTDTPLPLPSRTLLPGYRIALCGKLASMSKKQAIEWIEECGGIALDKPDAETHWLVVGEAELPSTGLTAVREKLDPPVRDALDAGQIELLTETELWRRLGLVEGESHVQQLYTPAMLAELLSVDVSQIRTWLRRGLLLAVREVRKLPYFDFAEVATARRIVELLAAGVSLRSITKQVQELQRNLPHIKRPLADLPLVVEGRRLLLRQETGLTELGGQLRLDFEAAFDSASEFTPHDATPATISLEQSTSQAAPTSPDEILRMAVELEEDGQLASAANLYRAALAAGGPTPETCFLLAEVLYRLGDLGGSRERYYMAIELNEDYVEARANLGCVLAELGELELAAAAFTGALAFHPEYADAHYHLARVLDDLQRTAEARNHWQAFLDLAPETPWADAARERLDRV